MKLDRVLYTGLPGGRPFITIKLVILANCNSFQAKFSCQGDGLCHGHAIHPCVRTRKVRGCCRDCSSAASSRWLRTGGARWIKVGWLGRLPVERAYLLWEAGRGE